MDREKLRSMAPEMAAFVDKVRAEFPDAKVTYLRINDLEYGKKSTEPTPVSDTRVVVVAPRAAKGRG